MNRRSASHVDQLRNWLLSFVPTSCEFITFVDPRLFHSDLIFRSLRLSQKARLLLDAFKENNAAAFLASANQPDSIPKLDGLSEVCQSPIVA